MNIDPTLRRALHSLHTDEAEDRATLDRRRFLQLVGLGAAAGTIGHPVLDLVLGDGPTAFSAGPLGPGDRILVLLGLYGGNDGLNTVVPVNDGLYYGQHGSLAIPGSSTLPLTRDFGLHRNLTEVKRLWDAGQCAIVHGVGYPQPDHSHFNSTAYWMSGERTSTPTTGWIGRWLDGVLGGSRDLYVAAEIGSSVPLHLVGRNQRGTVVPAARPEFGASSFDRDQRFYAAVRELAGAATTPLQTATSQSFVDQMGLASRIAGAYPPRPTESDAVPVDQLPLLKSEVAARLINANLGFRVLTIGWPDFDSHAGQVAMHDKRMAELNEMLRRFYATLDPAWASRVVVMTWSEFGRTSWANDGQGTDHGSSAPQFVIGGGVRGGMYGASPSLAGLSRWDRMAHHVDYRSLYATVIDGWLGGGASEVLGATYEDLGIFSSGPSGGTSPVVASPSPPASLVPVDPVRVLDTRDGTGGVMRRPLGPGESVRVPIAGIASIPASGVIAVAANVTSVLASETNHFTVYPGGTSRPDTSSLNGGPGRAVPNLVIMGTGVDGTIEIFNSHGTAHCIVDVFGYFGTTGSGFTSLPPARLFDTRTGVGVRAGQVRNQERIGVRVAGSHGVPPAGATAVAINLTATRTASTGHLRMAPSDKADGHTSNVNFGRGDTVANLTICRLGADGSIIVEGVGDGCDVVGDVFGYFGPTGDRMYALPPRRLLDSRSGLGGTAGALRPDVPIRLDVANRGGVPASARAAVLNVTATGVTGPAHVTVWPAGTARPSTSNLNLHPGRTTANSVICQLGQGGALELATSVSATHLIADVVGYFGG